MSSSKELRLREPFVAYRGWWARPLFGLGNSPYPLALYPLSNATAWDAGENEAACRPPCNTKPGVTEEHLSPDPKCACGLHAFLRLPEVRVGTCVGGGVWIIGAVMVWGKMLSGGTIVRASHAEPLVVAALDDGNLAAQKIAREYEIPCCPREHLRDVALEFGREIPVFAVQAVNSR